MSTTGADSRQVQALDPNEKTETRKRARTEPVDDDWDLDVPAATSLPPVVTKAAVGKGSKAPPVVGKSSSGAAPATSEANQAVSGGPILSSKFPSAMRELAKSDPSLLSAIDLVSSEPAKSAPDSFVSVTSDAIGLTPAKSEPNAVAPVKYESIIPSPVVGVGDMTTPSVGQQEAEQLLLVELPSGSAGRERQESLLSLDTDYAVEFFSSAPPAVVVNVQEAYEIEFGDAPERRSLIPSEQLVVRRRYFRKVVIQVMFVALALFVFTLYVMWQRGVFARIE